MPGYGDLEAEATRGGDGDKPDLASLWPVRPIKGLSTATRIVLRERWGDGS
jgi:hypothetical protein